MLQLEV